MYLSLMCYRGCHIIVSVIIDTHGHHNNNLGSPIQRALQGFVSVMNLMPSFTYTGQKIYKLFHFKKFYHVYMISMSNVTGRSTLARHQCICLIFLKSQRCLSLKFTNLEPFRFPCVPLILLLTIA